MNLSFDMLRNALQIGIYKVIAPFVRLLRLLQARKEIEARVIRQAIWLPAPGKKVAATTLLLVLGLVFNQPRPARAQVPATVFPVPVGIVNQLFYLQRDPNSNTVIYQLNVDAAGHLNEDEPVRAFWIRYTENGEHQDLSFIQRKFAYGLTAQKLAPDKYELKFAAYGKLRFFLMRSGTDKVFHVFTTIANRQLVLTRVFLRIEGGTFWVPNVKYIEFKGWNAASHEPIVERVNV